MKRIDIFCHQEVFPINRLLRQQSSANLNLSKTTEKEGIYIEKNNYYRRLTPTYSLPRNFLTSCYDSWYTNLLLLYLFEGILFILHLHTFSWKEIADFLQLYKPNTHLITPSRKGLLIHQQKNTHWTLSRKTLCTIVQ